MSEEAQKTIDQVKGDLGLFKRLTSAVDFAVQAVEVFEAREARGRELANAEKALDETIKKLKADKETLEKQINGLNTTASEVINKANDRAAEIIAEARKQAADLIEKTNNDLGIVNRDIERGKTARSNLQDEIATLKTDKETADTELKTITGQLKSALDKFKK